MNAVAHIDDELAALPRSVGRCAVCDVLFDRRIFVDGRLVRYRQGNHCPAHAWTRSTVVHIDRVTRFEKDARCVRFVEEHPDGATFEEVGQELGCTRERVRQLEATALRKLLETLTAAGWSRADVHAHIGAIVEGRCRRAPSTPSLAVSIATPPPVAEADVVASSPEVLAWIEALDAAAEVGEIVVRASKESP